MTRKQVALAFVLGAATVPAFAPFYLYPLPLITLAAFAVLLLRANSTYRAVAIGFSFGLGLLVTGTSWVYVSLHDYGGMPMPVAALATLLRIVPGSDNCPLGRCRYGLARAAHSLWRKQDIS